MEHIELILKNAESDPTLLSKYYERIIVWKIRERYSLNQELAILRQRDDKPEEFREYHDFVEACKRYAKELCEGVSA